MEDVLSALRGVVPFSVELKVDSLGGGVVSRFPLTVATSAPLSSEYKSNRSVSDEYNSIK